MSVLGHSTDLVQMLAI